MAQQTVVDRQSGVQSWNARSEDRPGFGARVVAMAHAAVDRGGDWRHVVGRLARDEAGCNLDGTAVTGLARGYAHLCVIKLRGRPARRFAAETGGMAALAQVARGHVTALFAHRFRAVVAAHAAAGDTRVIEGGSE